GGTKIIDASAPVSCTASCTVLKTGRPIWVLPPLPGVTPPTRRVPYSTACSEWKVPCWPVKPWVITLVFLSTKTLMDRSSKILLSAVGIPSRASYLVPADSAAEASPMGPRRVLVDCSGGLDGRNCLFGRVIEVIGRRDGQPGTGQQFATFFDIGALQTDDHGNRQADFLDRGDDALGDQVATHDAAENVDQDGLDLVRAQDQLE